MNTKFLLSVVGAVVVVTSGAYFIISPYVREGTEQSNTSDAPDSGFNQQQRITEGVFAPQFDEEKIGETEKEDDGSEDTDVVPQKPSVAPVIPKPVPVAHTPAPSPYTAAAVATHNSETSCWSIIDDTVYDVTSFVSKHPGGDRNILKICGKDGTSAFMGQHGGDSKPESTLTKYYLGKLSE